ncbi:MAG TPA: pyridoxal phosphate-dependent aminotransferase [Synergistaceae bacterium]|nr:pyridoxal phosphate-dependent aminotransferase [Synergistaceae bacterium]HPJ26282.1 pyridoxal phosphate-dependent aminotransferase [Synergistaceae bacterium]HPQ37624.1 pyridoxal phosphate-dependent aminotransferase [Synergistaceae bacterium]
MSRIHFPNSRMSSIPLRGGIREILSRSNELEREGRSIIHMEIGRPDFDSPECAKAGAAEALRCGDVHYTDISGSLSLREAIAEKYRRCNRMQVDPGCHIIVTVGAVEALMMTFLAVLEPGDEVLIPSPFFPAYADQIALANGRVVNVPCRMENDFRLRVEDLEKAITPKSRMILLNTPNNPSGAVFTRKDLEAVAELARKRDLWIVSDECYENFLYEGEHVSMASLPGMAERTVTVGTASKTWSMTGWRVGWAIVPERMKPYAAKCHQNVTTCCNSFAQAGVVRALREAGKDVTAMIEEYKRRRDMVFGYLQKMEGIETVKPEGTFFAFPSIRKLRVSPLEFCTSLLEEEGVATVPGDAFGVTGFIRLAYCRSYEDIEEGMRRMGRFAAKYVS